MFYTTETISSAIALCKEKKSYAFLVIFETAESTLMYRIIKDIVNNYTVNTLDEKSIIINTDGYSFQEIIEAYQKLYNVPDDDTCIFTTTGSIGLMQAMASNLPLSMVINTRNIGKPDAMSLLAISQDTLQLPIKVNGYFIEKSYDHCPFFKIMISEGMDFERITFRATYTVDISTLVGKQNKDEICINNIDCIDTKLNMFVPYNRVIFSYTKLNSKNEYEVMHMPNGYDAEFDIPERIIVQL